MSDRTLARLYDRAMREHQRRAVLVHWENGERVETPDWRFDRLVIRLALYLESRLQVRAGERIVVFGALSPLWLAADFAVLGLGAVSVGLAHTLSDEDVTGAVQSAGARAAFTTDADSAARLLHIGSRTGGLETVVTPQPSEDRGALPVAALLDMAATLDTPENAQSFRDTARALEPDAPALWHLGAAGADGIARLERLTHRQAMADVGERLLRRPGRRGDVAFVEGPVTRALRSACHAFVGDGLTTLAVGAGRPPQEVAALHPARLVVTAPLLAQIRLAAEDAAREGLPGVLDLPGLGRLRSRVLARRLRRSWGALSPSGPDVELNFDGGIHA